MTLILAHATIRFLEDVNACWGAGWVRALTRAITEGTLVELDGEACILGALREGAPTPIEGGGLWGPVPFTISKPELEIEKGEICDVSRGNKSQLRMEM